MNVARSVVPLLRVVMECKSCHDFLDLDEFEAEKWWACLDLNQGLLVPNQQA